jgi:RNA-directed DNA polymerase
MKESYSEGLAIHAGPESCGAAREGGVEALIGEGAGRVFSRENTILRDADAVRRGGRQHCVCRYCEAHTSPAWSQTPRTYRNTPHGNREVPRSPRAEDALGRIGKSEDVRR